MRHFSVRVAGDDLTFSAGHFITLEGGQCERLHGHSYHVIVEVQGPIGASQYVVDFVAVREILKVILAGLDHRVLLPAQHPAIHVAVGSKEVEVTFSDRRWVFPQDDCLMLPLENTTTELLAEHIGRRLLVELKAGTGARIDVVRVELSEGTGCSATCKLCD